MSKMLLDLLFEVLKSFAGLALTAVIVWFLAHRELIGKAFFGRVTFSYIGLSNDQGSHDGNEVTIETLLDKRLGEVLIDNRVLRSRVFKAAQKCDDQNPFVLLPKGDMYHVKSGVRHQLSGRYSDGVVDRAFDIEVRKQELVTALCFTRSDRGAASKLRAFVVRPDVLDRIAAEYETMVENNPHRKQTLKTLKAMHDRWTEEKAGKNDIKVVHTVRIYRRV